MVALREGGDADEVELDIYVEGSHFQLLSSPTVVHILDYLDLRDFGTRSRAGATAVSRRWLVMSEKDSIWRKWGSRVAKKAESKVGAIVARNNRILSFERTKMRRIKRTENAYIAIPLTLSVVSVVAVVLPFTIMLALKLDGHDMSWKTVFVPYWIMLGTSLFGGLLVAFATCCGFLKCCCARLVTERGGGGLLGGLGRALGGARVRAQGRGL